LKILILDDEKFRHDKFSSHYKGNEIFHAMNYSQFVNVLQTQKWDLIHLDHDLGEEPVADSYRDGWGNICFFTGYHAALKICELSEDYLPNLVIIHSMNPRGSEEIYSVLKRNNIETLQKTYSFF